MHSERWTHRTIRRLFLVLPTKKGFQINFGKMAYSANEVPTDRAWANHNTASKYQFEIPSKALLAIALSSLEIAF